MPRIARGLVGGMFYHVLNRGNGKQTVFHKDQDYQVFLELMGAAREKYPGVRLVAYCLMPNHFHFILWPEQGEDLSRWMQVLMTAHVRRYHQHYGTAGHVWQGRYKSFVIQDDDHLLTVMRYVEGNPVRSGLVFSAVDWPWSSHRERTVGGGFLPPDSPPLKLPDNWTEFVDHRLTAGELDRIRTSVVRQAPFGTPDWQAKTARELGIESTLRMRGRPKRRDD